MTNDKHSVDDTINSILDFDDSDFEHYGGTEDLHNSDSLIHSYHDAERMNLYEPDNLFGIKRNKQKKAEKKIKKAEKQLAKGHTKAAERKLAKGTKILDQIQKDQSAIIDAKNQIQDVNQTKAVMSAMDTKATESPDTSPGQIGSNAGQTSLSAQPPVSGGGGGGDMGGDMGYYPEQSTTSSGAVDPNAPGETSTEGNPKELPGVTVSNSKKNPIVMYVIIGVLVLVAAFFLMKRKK